MAQSQTPWQGMCEERFEKSSRSLLMSMFLCVLGKKHVINILDNIIQCCVSREDSICLFGEQ